jgi:hypothetical protein
MDIVGLVLSYNVPEVTDRLVENIRSVSSVRWPLVVYDNGSQLSKKSKYTTHGGNPNLRMTGGFNAGLEIIRKEHPKAHAVWLFTSDCYFTTPRCPVKTVAGCFGLYPDLGILHPSEDPKVHCCWDVHNQQPNGIKIGWMYDFVCPIFTRQALDLMNWQFRPALKLGWGLDFESSWIVREAGLKVGVVHDLVINHETSTTYDRGADGVYSNRKQFYDAALLEMRGVLGKAYGPNWEHRFKTEHVQEVGQWRL